MDDNLPYKYKLGSTNKPYTGHKSLVIHQNALKAVITDGWTNKHCDIYSCIITTNNGYYSTEILLNIKELRTDSFYYFSV